MDSPIDDDLAVSKSFRELTRTLFKEKTLGGDDLEQLASLPLAAVNRFLGSLNFASSLLLGRAFPSNWGEVARRTVHAFLKSIPSASIFTLAKVASQGSRLGDAIRDAAVIEHLLLCGKMDAADESFVEFTKRYGVSLWGMEVKFLVSQQKHGLPGNRSALAIFKGQCDTNLVNYFAQISSLGVQPTVSSDEYAASLAFLTDADSGKFPAYSRDYLRYRLLNALPRSDEAYCNIIHFEGHYPLIDQYNTLIRLTSRRIADGGIDDREIEGLSLVNRRLKDPSLSVLISIASGGESLENEVDEGSDIQRVFRLYRSRQYREVVEIAKDLLQSPTTTCFAIINIAAKAAAAWDPRSAEALFAENSPGQSLVNSLVQWHSASRSREDTLEELRRHSRMLHCIRLGHSLLEFVRLADIDVVPLANEGVDLLASPTALPEQALAMKDSTAAWDYFTKWAELFGDVPGLRAYLSARKADLAYTDSRSIPLVNNLHYRAASLFNAGDLVGAAREFRKLRELSETDSPLAPDSFSAEIVALVNSSQYEQAASIAAEAYCADYRQIPPGVMRLLRGLMLGSALKYDPSNISWAILASSSAKLDDESLHSDRVHDFVGDYIESQGFTRPTELLPRVADLPASLRTFLTDSCIPSVLESSIWYASQEEVLKERFALCNSLREQHGVDTHKMATEIKDLTRKLAVLDLTSRIERSRIFVDIEAIAANVEETTYDQLRSLLSIRALLNQDLRRGLRLLGMPDLESGKVIALAIDEDLAYFEEAFNRVRQRFLYSPEHGLDANLSQRVRHGTLAGEMRAIFDRVDLSTKTDSDGNYLPNTQWLNNLAVSEQGEADRIVEVFRQFSLRLDLLIQQVRMEWIQIRDTDSPMGLFNYDYSQDQIERCLAKVSALDDVGDVVDMILTELWTRTQECLMIVRRTIASDLNNELDVLLDSLLAGIEDIADHNSSLNIGALRAAITQSKTALVRELEKIANWFQLEDRREHKSFKFGDLVATLKNTLNRIGTPIDVDVNDSAAATQLQGMYFRPVWDLLVILLDNAAKHCGFPVAAVSLDATFTSSRSVISCVNKVAVDGKADYLPKLANQLNSLTLENPDDLSKLRREGGSGVAKLHKIIRHDLSTSAAGYAIVFSVSGDNEFRISMSFERGLQDANFAS